MIFWWSEDRLDKFIEVSIRQGRIQQYIDDLTEELGTINKKVDNNERNIKNLGNSVQEIIDFINNSFSVIQNKNQSIPVDVDELMATITKQVEKYFTDTTAKLNKVERRLSELEQKQVRATDTNNINFDIDALISSIKSDYIKYVNNAISQNNATLSAYENEFKRILAQVEKQTHSDLVEQIIRDYENEKNKNAELLEIVKKQSEEIKRQSQESKKQSEIIALCVQKIEELECKVNPLNSKLEIKNVKEEVQELKSTQTKIKPLVFDDNENKNKSKLLNLLEKAKILKEKLSGIGIEDTDIYMKLVDNLINKLSKLIDKNDERKYTADKLANETARALRQTIVKGLSQKKIKGLFIQYMDECGIRKLDWHVGKKLTDDDYEYLEEPIIYEEVSDTTKIGTILEIIQDTYLIDYCEDDGKYEVIIHGMYRIGKGIK